MSKRALSSHLLVVTQLIAVAGCCFPFGPAQTPGYVSAFLIVGGIALGVLTLGFNKIGNFSIYPEPTAGARLIVNGPYRHIRHPMYAALSLMMLGIALYNGHWVNALAWGVLLSALVGKILREEAFLPHVFPQYAAYAKRTARLVPGLW